MMLQDILPCPSKETSIQDIIDFRKQNRDDLMQFRKCLDNFISEMRSTLERSPEQMAIESKYRKLEKEIEGNLDLIEKKLQKSHIDFVKKSIGIMAPILFQLLEEKGSFNIVEKILEENVIKFIASKLNNDKYVYDSSYAYLFDLKGNGFI